jgi:hypothetical protein
VFWDTPEGRPFEETMARGFGGAPSITPPLITCVTPPWYLYRIRSGFAVGVARGDVEDVVDRDVAEDAEVKEKPESEISESESDSESQSESASESEAEASSSASKE